MDKNLLSEQIEKLGIYELRSLARSMGVQSPTSKKREELISAIKDIQSGTLKPQFNNFGRPVKKLSNQNELLSHLIINGDKELEDKIKKEENDDSEYIVFQQNFDSDDNPLNYNLITFKGIVRKTEKGSYYALNNLKIGTKTYVLIDDAQVKKFNLIVGDLLEGSAYMHSSKAYAKLNNIQYINGEVKENNIYDLDCELIIPEKYLDETLKQGRCKIDFVDGVDGSINYIEKKSKEYGQKGFKNIVLGLEISIETKLKLDRIENITEIVSLIEDEASFSYDKISDAINHANSMFYHNKNVVLFVLDAMSLYRVLDAVYKSNSIFHDEQVKYLIRKLLGSAKSSKTSSISNIVLFYDYQKNQYVNEYNDLLTIIKS